MLRTIPSTSCWGRLSLCVPREMVTVGRPTVLATAIAPSRPWVAAQGRLFLQGSPAPVGTERALSRSTPPCPEGRPGPGGGARPGAVHRAGPPSDPLARSREGARREGSRPLPSKEEPGARRGRCGGQKDRVVPFTAAAEKRCRGAPHQGRPGIRPARADHALRKPLRRYTAARRPSPKS